MSLHTPRENTSLPIRSQATEAGRWPLSTGDGGPVIQKTLRLVQRNEFSQAADLLRSAGQTPVTRNALGVCLMRAGKIDEALRIYRNLVLSSGSTWERTEVPSLYKRNFATALLLAGLPAGCLDVLRSAGEAEHPNTLRLRQAIKDWEKSLSFWRRWDWRLNQVVPAHCSIPITFTPGEFEHELVEEAPAARIAHSQRKSSS